MKFYIFVSLACLLMTNPVVADEPTLWGGTLYFEMACGSDNPVYLFNTPNGNGSAFTEAQLFGGTVVDATITVTLQDFMGEPIGAYPAEDIWLEASGFGMIRCVGGGIADAATDESGVTHFVEPVNAGGFAQGTTLVVAAMFIEQSSDPLPLNFNSSDLNGDGTTNLADVGLFSSHFFGDYTFGADFFCDGVLNLADVGRLAQGLGGSCP